MIFKIDIVANIGKASVAKIAIKIDMTRIQINKIRGIIIKTAKKTEKTPQPYLNKQGVQFDVPQNGTVPDLL